MWEHGTGDTVGVCRMHSNTCLFVNKKPVIFIRLSERPGSYGLLSSFVKSFMLECAPNIGGLPWGQVTALF